MYRWSFGNWRKKKRNMCNRVFDSISLQIWLQLFTYYYSLITQIFHQSDSIQYMHWLMQFICVNCYSFFTVFFFLHKWDNIIIDAFCSDIWFESNVQYAHWSTDKLKYATVQNDLISILNCGSYWIHAKEKLDFYIKNGFKFWYRRTIENEWTFLNIKKKNTLSFCLFAMTNMANWYFNFRFFCFVFFLLLRDIRDKDMLSPSKI